MKIGNRSSAIQRIGDYVSKFERCMMREPGDLILFAEDFDALRDDVPQRYSRYRFIRGPSIAEYRPGAPQ